ncbi:hypothetical protein [Nakamurella sp.]|uniref:hypothetical protein n=1 Tax=Nakamurella sp. TaxID=1869182 RepID=UPI003B3BA7B3
MEEGIELERLHTVDVLDTPTRFNKRVVVTAEVYETPTETEPGVEVENGDHLYNREQVETLIAALREAADLAFGPAPEDVPATPGRDESAAALVELMDRALRPYDVNRLVAAAFRYRNACIAAGETR